MRLSASKSVNLLTHAIDSYIRFSCYPASRIIKSSRTVLLFVQENPFLAIVLGVTQRRRYSGIVILVVRLYSRGRSSQGEGKLESRQCLGSVDVAILLYNL